MATVAQVFQIIGTLITGVGVWVAASSILENHRWNRLQFAVNLIEGWNEKTLIHRKRLESAYPGIINKDLQSLEAFRRDALSIYSASPNDENKWNLRFSILELLNYFEYISSSYGRTADQTTIDKSFKEPLWRYHSALKDFIAIVDDQRGYQVWEPYAVLIKHWSEPPKHQSVITGTLSSLFGGLFKR